MESLALILVGVFEKVGTLLQFFVDLNLPFNKDAKGEMKRSMANPSGDKSKKSSEDAFQRKLFECPGCFDIPEPPIFSCSAGHMICSFCRTELEECPEADCGGDYKGNARNFVVEQIIESKSFPCRFSEEGCTVSMKSKQLLQHQQACRFRHVQCNVVMDGCCDGLGNWVGSIKKYYAHLVLVHELNFVFRNKNVSFTARVHPETKEFMKFVSPVVALKVVQGRNFIMQPYFDEESQNVFIFMTGVYGADEEGEETVEPAKVSIRLLRKTAANNNEEILWMGPVNSVYDSLIETLEKENGLVIKWQDFLKECTFVEGLAKWDFQVEIHPPVVVSTKPSEVPLYSTVFESIRTALPKFLQPFIQSAWSVVAPGFTLFVIFFFVFIV